MTYEQEVKRMKINHASYSPALHTAILLFERMLTPETALNEAQILFQLCKLRLQEEIKEP